MRRGTLGGHVCCQKVMKSAGLCSENRSKLAKGMGC